MICGSNKLAMRSNSKIAQAIQMCVLNKGVVELDWNTFEEMKAHAIASLPMDCLKSVVSSADLSKEWANYIIRQFAYNTRYNKIEKELPITVPYVILKGSAAAKYYPNPDCRTMGDIDILTDIGDIKIACQQLIEDGFVVCENSKREILLKKNGIEVELHSFFSTLNDPAKSSEFDSILIQNINPTHYLPDLINGLVIIEHINHHLENGLGFRQIIDWMMFVNSYLNDITWPSFCVLAQRFDLEYLSKTVTRMCELHFGLVAGDWCKDVDVNLCNELFDYVYDCGNFGRKQTYSSKIFSRLYSFSKSPIRLYEVLQYRGMRNKKQVGRSKIPICFAWIWQSFYYLNLAASRKTPFISLYRDIKEGKKRNKLFGALGVEQSYKKSIKKR